ncbi:hypothetical protein KEH51_00380 [[Brevibacterium] frigoritolerans]|uniref:Uncharacterized protein n=1 Tax=Peribacillus frigoritolerans TaxID=450367 RepID=A0A941FPF3_9BACI|nr:hypothetical protein [Peribacillus frigoritolerans]
MTLTDLENEYIKISKIEERNPTIIPLSRIHFI